MATVESFQAVFAVPMTCNGCVKDVSEALYKVGGISKVEANLSDQLVLVEGTAAPSSVVEAIQATGKDAILRGSGGSNSAAVSILETYHHEANRGDQNPSSSSSTRDVRGLARMVQVSKTHTLVDLTVRGVAPGAYRATIREFGNLQDGAASVGPVWGSTTTTTGDGAATTGFLGTVDVGTDGSGSAFINHPFQVWEAIGHAMVLTRQGEDPTGEPLRNDEDTLAGIVARSAGIWENDKTVCSCSGKTLWEERTDEVNKGML